ncbi:MAG: hypothetical protein WCG93_10920 [Paludibacter sp.]
MNRIKFFKSRIVFLLFILFLLSNTAFSQDKSKVINQIASFDAVNHPQVAYWFFSKDMLSPERFEGKIDSLCQLSKYTLIFLTSRNGVDFYKPEIMHPVFERLVKYAHQRGLKIGLQLWDKKYKVPIENTERMIQEGEITLDDNGAGSYSVKAKHVRDMKSLLKSELFKVYAFRKAGDGFYEPGSLTDITAQCKPVESKETVELKLNAGKKMKGYTAFILTQHYYNYCSNHSAEAVSNLTQALKSYSDIPFDGVGLDEYTNMRVATTWELKKANEVFRGRPYSLAMAEKLKSATGMEMYKTLLDMRYAPLGKPEIRIKAINNYMAVMRSGTMNMERIIYDKGKEFYGPTTFIGLHDTHHNFLDGDEIWQTGLNWWNVKRDYGHSDEGTPTATQMGIGFTYPKNVMYNMYYNKSLEKITTKAYSDLTYGIRTHYHAINDIQNWGVSVEKPEALAEINKVENAARLLNRFNPSFPKIKLLVVFGMESLVNWYPDSTKRGMTDINNSLNIEKKAVEIWNAGYLNALVPTDLIADGRLKINANGKPEIQGHEFDAVVFLYPQYARKSTFDFLKKYVDNGGKLMVEGSATYDFEGNNISKQWKAIEDKAILKSFNVAEVSKLGVSKREFENGVQNEDGSYSFTGIKDAQTFAIANSSYTINCNGLAAIQFDEAGKMKKLVATSFSSLKKDGKTILSLSKPADISAVVNNGIADITVADETKTTKINVEL